MRRLCLTIMAASIAAFVIGCSKHPSGTSSQTSTNATDSGAVGTVAEQATNSAVTNETGTNDLLAIALKTHTKQAWLNELYHQIESDPDINEELNVNPRAGIRAMRALTNASSAQLFMNASTNKVSDVENSKQIKQP